MELKNVEMSDAMIKRADELDKATYEYFLVLLELTNAKIEKVESIFPWDISILRELLDYAITLLERKDLSVCNPYIVLKQDMEYRCSVGECGCEECHCQDFLEDNK